MNELQAVNGLQRGSEEAFSWLMDRYMPYVNTVVCNIIGSSMTAPDIEEVDADVFVSLWNHAKDVRAESIKGWLGSVARNAAKKKLRELKRELPLEDDILVIDATLENEVERRELKSFVREAVLNMDQPAREIFLRHYFYGQTVASIAEDMSINPSTVKNHLTRGREKLRSVLANKIGTEGDVRYGMEYL